MRATYLLDGVFSSFQNSNVDTQLTWFAHRLTMHNVHYLLSLMGKVRAAIVEDRYPEFLRAYFNKAYGGDMTRVPTWAVTALREVGVDLLA